VVVNAAELLKQVAERGVRVSLVGESLHLRPKSALPPELVAKLREHKPELLQLLAANAPVRVADTLGGPVEPEQESLLVADVVAMPLEKFATARLVIRVSSEVLGESVIFASDNAAVDPGERLVVYRARELKLLLGAGPKDIRTLHTAKKEFGGTIEAS